MKKILFLVFIIILGCNFSVKAVDDKIDIPRVNVFNRAVKNGDIEKVKEYINAGFDPNETYMGCAILCTAIQRNQNEMLDFLLKNGAKANNPKSQVQPLYYAVTKRNPYAVDKLLKADADPDRTFMGYTAEELATMYNYKDILGVFKNYREQKQLLSKNNTEKSNQLCGIGVQLYKDKNKLYVINVLKNSPASKVYLPVGAEILQVDTIKVKNLTIDEVSEKIRGEKATKVNILAKSNSGKKLYTIERQPIQLPKRNKDKNFNVRWLEVVPEQYANSEYIEILPQYSNKLKMQLDIGNYWAARKESFKKGYDACMTYPKNEQSSCFMNLVNREIQKTENDRQSEVQERMYHQQAAQNFVNTMNQIQTNTNLQNINNSIQQNTFQMQQQNMQLWQINNSIQRF